MVPRDDDDDDIADRFLVNPSRHLAIGPQQWRHDVMKLTHKSGV